MVGRCRARRCGRRQPAEIVVTDDIVDTCRPFYRPGDGKTFVFDVARVTASAKTTRQFKNASAGCRMFPSTTVIYAGQAFRNECFLFPTLQIPANCMSHISGRGRNGSSISRTHLPVCPSDFGTTMTGLPGRR